MASLNFTHDIVTDNYIVAENGITYEMSSSYFKRLSNWIRFQYKSFYTEESRGVFNWYRDDLLLQERKNIKVTGLEMEDEDEPDS